MLDKIPTELKYVLIMAAIVLFQYLLKRFGPQPVAQAPVPPEQEASQFPEEEANDARAAPADPGVGAGYFGRTVAPRVAAPRARRRYARSSLMGTKRQTQNAVVIAVILGPCRAFEPYDPR